LAGDTAKLFVSKNKSQPCARIEFWYAKHADRFVTVPPQGVRRTV